MREQGLSLQQIGKIFNISRERVRQILNQEDHFSRQKTHAQIVEMVLEMRGKGLPLMQISSDLNLPYERVRQISKGNYQYGERRTKPNPKIKQLIIKQEQI